MLLSKLSSPFTLMVEQPVSFVTLVMVLPTQFQFMKLSQFHMPSRRTILLVEPLPPIWSTSLPPMVSLRQVENPLGPKLLDPLRNNFVTSPLMLKLNRLKHKAAQNSKRTTSSQMVPPLWSTPQDSWLQKPSSSHPSSRKVTKL